MAAARLGAGPVLGLDIDREILQVARENLERNALTDDVDLSIQPVGELETTWDVVVANIRSRILRDLRDDLMARVAPGGWLLLSGVMVDQGEAFREEGLPTSSDWRLEREIERSNWLGFELQREA
jgi:ribosomal protein L11 methyltransferase